MTPCINRILLSLVLLTAAAVPRAHADGGTLRLTEQVGPYRVAIFTAPSMPSMGPIDVSVLVQDGASGALIPDAEVEITLRAADGEGPTLHAVATHEAASNKLFQAALFEVPRAGRWHAEITVKGSGGAARSAFAFEVGSPPTGWLSMSLWIGWPMVVIALFAAHQVLVRRARK